MKFVTLALVAVFGFALGGVLFHAPTVGAQSNGVAVRIYGDTLTSFSEAGHIWKGGYIETKGTQVVGFSCVVDSEGKPECFVAVTK